MIKIKGGLELGHQNYRSVNIVHKFIIAMKGKSIEYICVYSISFDSIRRTIHFDIFNKKTLSLDDTRRPSLANTIIINLPSSIII